MDWKPISESEIRNLIHSAADRMNPEQRRVWDKIRIAPEKWIQEPWGNEGNGFWVVALLGRNVVWFNDIEDGFNQTVYVEYGTIDEYGCNQNQLEWAIQGIINDLQGK